MKIDINNTLNQTKNLRVLLVLDNENDTEIVEGVSFFFDDVDVAGVEKSIELYRRLKYDIVFFNIASAGIFENFVKMIKRASLRQIIIAILKENTFTDLPAILSLGVSTFITSPIKKETLARVLERESQILFASKREESYKKDLEETVFILQRKSLELETLNNIIGEAIRCKKAKDIVALILDGALEYLDADGGEAHLFDEERLMPITSITKGIARDVREAMRISPVGDTPYDGFSYADDYLLFEDTTEVFGAFSAITGVCAIALFPIKSVDKILGRIDIFFKRPTDISVEETTFILTLMLEAGIAVNNALVEEKHAIYMKNLEEDLRRKAEGLKKAQVVQQNLNTRKMPVSKTFSLSVLFMPCEEIGGDFFDVRKKDGKIAFVLGDCSGHGIESAMDATLLKSLSDRYINSLLDGEPEVFLTLLNSEATRYFHDGNFPTMFAAIVEEESLLMHYANANSPLPYIIGENSVKMLERPRGFHLGFDSATIYHRKTITLKPEEAILLYSDAIVEIERDDDIISRKEIETLLKGKVIGGGSDIKRVINALKNLHPLPLNDDTTLILIEPVEEFSNTYKLKSKKDIENTLSLINNKMKKAGYNREREILTLTDSISSALNKTIEDSLNCDFCFEINGERAKASFLCENSEDIKNLMKNNKMPLENKFPDIYLKSFEIIEEKYSLSYIIHKNQTHAKFLYPEEESDFRHSQSQYSWSNIFGEDDISTDYAEIIIDFKDTSLISSAEIGVLLRIISKASLTNTKVILKTQSSRFVHLMNKLHISDMDNVSLFKNC